MSLRLPSMRGAGKGNRIELLFAYDPSFGDPAAGRTDRHSQDQGEVRLFGPLIEGNSVKGF